jgi:hypothetical protein
MKTAMQELIESIRFTDKECYATMFDEGIFKTLLEKEKEQIQNVFEHCWNHPNWKGEYDIKDMNNYINQKK